MRGELRGLTAVTAAAAVVAIASSAGCGGQSPAPARGLGSRQLLSLRDPELRLSGQGSDTVYIYAIDGTDGQPTSYFSIDVETGAMRAYGSTYPGHVTVDPPARLKCAYESDGTGDPDLVIEDVETGASTTITGVAYLVSVCPTLEAPEIQIWRSNAAGRVELWRGRYDGLELVPLDLGVDSVVSRRADGVFVTLAARADTPGAGLGLFTVDPVTGSSAELMPATLSGADAGWAPGALAAGELASSTLAPRVPSLFRPFPLGDHFMYARRMNDGSTTIFAGPFASGASRELALFTLEDSLYAVDYGGVFPPGATRLAFSTIWESVASPDAGATSTGTLYAWSSIERRLTACALPTAFYRLYAQQLDDRSVLVSSWPQDSSLDELGPLLLVSRDGAPQACNLLAGGDVASTAVAPDGAAFTWLVAPGSGERELWTAAAGGSGARKLGAGDIEGAEFMSATTLQVSLGGDLAWLDLRDDPVRLHYIAERVFAREPFPLTLGRWTLAGYDFNEQDRTGTLGFVDLDSGAKRAISPSVAEFDSLYWARTSAPDPVPPRPQRVLYLVRGRNPSSQDGLWLATFTADDLP